MFGYIDAKWKRKHELGEKLKKTKLTTANLFFVNESGRIQPIKSLIVTAKTITGGRGSYVQRYLKGTSDRQASQDFEAIKAGALQSLQRRMAWQQDEAKLFAAAAENTKAEIETLKKAKRSDYV